MASRLFGRVWALVSWMSSSFWRRPLVAPRPGRPGGRVTRKHVAVVAVAAALAGGGYVAVTAPHTCDPTLWSHVYNPSRLQVVSSCVEVTGSVVLVRKEADGDAHIQLALDPQFANMTNGANDNAQGGNLILEPICVFPVTQQDAIAACAGFKSPVSVPGVGQRVDTWGVYVLDTSPNHGWMEVHAPSGILAK